MRTDWLTKVIRRRHRKFLWVMIALCLLVGVINGWSIVNVVHQQPQMLFSPNIHRWRPDIAKAADEFSPLWTGLAWMAGAVMMNWDLKGHFNELLFTSGATRARIYWVKIKIYLGALLIGIIGGLILQHAFEFLGVPATYQNYDWPGLVTNWAVSLSTSFGFFAMGMFAALIIGQTLPLILTLVGFGWSWLIFLNAIVGRGLHLSSHWQADYGWPMVGVHLGLGLLLIIWGQFLFNCLSLEHDGEYLLFPQLKWPVYVVFVVYVTTVLGEAGSLGFMAVVFIATLAFGYWWLWRPKWHLSQLRHPSQSKN